MKDCYDFITLDDVKEFFKTLNLDWNYKYYQGHHGYKPAKNFLEIAYSKAPVKNLLLSTTHNISINLNVKITPYVFIIYSSLPQITQKSITYEVTKDYSENWRKFLKEKYKNKYANDVCKQG